MEGGFGPGWVGGVSPKNKRDVPIKLGLKSKSFTRNCFHDPLFTSGGSGAGNGQRSASFPGQLWEAEAEFLPELLREKQAGVLLSGARGHKDKVGRYGEPANTCVDEVGRLFCAGSCSGKAQPGFGVRQSWLEQL